jgi:THO complex subunit 2
MGSGEANCPKPTGAPSSPQPPTPSSTPLPTEKTRISSIPSGPASASAGDTCRSSSSAATPSAPRAQLASTVHLKRRATDPTIQDWPWEGKSALYMFALLEINTNLNCSIPRPEVVKRVRPDKSSQSPRPDAEGPLKAKLMDVDHKPPTAPSTSTNNGDRTSTKSANATARKDPSRPQTPNSAIINKKLHNLLEIVWRINNPE